MYLLMWFPHKFSFFLFFVLEILFLINGHLLQINEPTRPFDMWNPNKKRTTSKPINNRNDEVLVRLSIGNIVGKEVILKNIPWTVDHDPLDQIRIDAERFEPNPVPAKNNITVSAFLGVPYAEAPISQRRFKPPQLITELPGEKPFLAFHYAPTCAQDVENRPKLDINYPYAYRVDEDCLYLNIFTPEVSTTSLTKYPVIVFFHGGNFQTGSANDWPGHVLASRGIVVVTVNYRLGPFGFMSLGDTDTGNYGLQDQRTALLFVRDHISSFHGDPQAVTIVGHDAGAVSVGLHMLSPLSKNLFRSASAMSGAEISYHSTIGKPALAFNNTIKLGRYLGCAQTVAQDVWDCILTRSTNDLIQAIETIPIEYNRYLFLPTVDDREIMAHPFWMLNAVPSGTVNYASPVPYLTGLNRNDGVEVILEDRRLGEFNDFLLIDHSYMKEFILEYVFRHNYTMNREAISEAIESSYRYYPDASDVEAIRAKFIELTTDAYYTAPISLSAHLHASAGSRVFMYVNNYEFGRGGDEFFMPSWMGSCHLCDLYLLFGFPFMSGDLLPREFSKVTWTEYDRNASQIFSLIYRQFAKTQNPNLPSDSSWLPFEPRRHWYINFNYSIASRMAIPGKLERDYRWREVAFWNEYVPRLVQFMTTTFSPFVVKVRRELVAFQIGIGVIACILIIVLVLMGIFAYLLHEKNSQRLQRNLYEMERLDKSYFK